MGWPGPMPNRQFLVYREWTSRPSRTDRYIIQLTAEVRRTISKDPTKEIPADQFILRPRSVPATTSKPTSTSGPKRMTAEDVVKARTAFSKYQSGYYQKIKAKPANRTSPPRRRSQKQ